MLGAESEAAGGEEVEYGQRDGCRNACMGVAVGVVRYVWGRVTVGGFGNETRVTRFPRLSMNAPVRVGESRWRRWMGM
jgi:hypothetical protein